mmetsp:Transcript_48154/g.102428  ORF Transcript_48154/g.102428 Transcript_48154/m.102428 type:complete len:277 (-) Transcript_48154:8-838(-)
MFTSTLSIGQELVSEATPIPLLVTISTLSAPNLIAWRAKSSAEYSSPISTTFFPRTRWSKLGPVCEACITLPPNPPDFRTWSISYGMRGLPLSPAAQMHMSKEPLLSSDSSTVNFFDSASYFTCSTRVLNLTSSKILGLFFVHLVKRYSRTCSRGKNIGIARPKCSWNVWSKNSISSFGPFVQRASYMLVDSSPLVCPPPQNLLDRHTPPGPDDFSKQVTTGSASRAVASPSSSSLARRVASAWRKNIPLGPHPIRATDGGFVVIMLCIWTMEWIA